jgi:hypothetical protein
VFASHSVEWATKVDAIPGDESPIAIDDDGFQFPVLPPALANPGDVRRFCMTSLLSEFRQFLAQAFVVYAFWRNAKWRSAGQKVAKHRALGESILGD